MKKRFRLMSQPLPPVLTNILEQAEVLVAGQLSVVELLGPRSGSERVPNDRLSRTGFVDSTRAKPSSNMAVTWDDDVRATRSVLRSSGVSLPKSISDRLAIGFPQCAQHLHAALGRFEHGEQVAQSSVPFGSYVTLVTGIDTSPILT